MYDDSHQRGFWRLARVQKLVKGVDGQVRGAVICIQSKGEKRNTTLRHPVTHLYPLEIIEENVDRTTKSASPVEPPATSENSRSGIDPQPQSRRPRREAAERAREWMQAVLND